MPAVLMVCCPLAAAVCLGSAPLDVNIGSLSGHGRGLQSNCC